MHSLNPFLRAFFRSSLPRQCQSANDYILFVPTTESLISGRDGESGALYTDLVSSEEFLASHVLRSAITPANGDGSIRDGRGKARSFETINGRSLVVKESFVYSNKGFKSFTQAQILTDEIFHADGADRQSWLVYHISKPLIGHYEPIRITPAVLQRVTQQVGSSHGNSAQSSQSAKSSPATESLKEIKAFQDVLHGYPMIARHMNPGIERILASFHRSINDWVPSVTSPVSVSSSRRSSIESTSASTTASANGDVSKARARRSRRPRMTVFDEEENHMQEALETAIVAAITLLHKLDKHQVSFLKSTSGMTLARLEPMLEAHITEQLHHAFLFPRLCNSKKVGDYDLENKISHMQYLDVAQVGLVIKDGRAEKDQMVQNITKAAVEFKKMNVAATPQQMLDILLTTQKLVTGQPEVERDVMSQEKASSTTMNADTLVSLLLMVVIRSQIRHLHARLAYMRNFIFLDDVDTGEAGYALSTLEAVLSYLSTDAAGLRRASRKNRHLWTAAKTGNVQALRDIFCSSETSSQFDHLTPIPVQNGIDEAPNDIGNETAPALDFSRMDALPEISKKIKRVSMDTQSLSNISDTDTSLISRTNTADSTTSVIEEDTSNETLAQTQDINGRSVLIMAVASEQLAVLQFLLNLEEYYPPEFVLEDADKDGMTLLSHAIQLNNRKIITLILAKLRSDDDSVKLQKYLARADVRGRTAGHYLFHAPWLLQEIGTVLPWRQKDQLGQTPLLALCRSYDHPEYLDMVTTAMDLAVEQQGDGERLHLDDHVDFKGNTLLHAVNEPVLAMRILKTCDADPNATNDKQFTPLMVASKYGRMDMVRTFFGDAQVDISIREARGMNAVELAKDDVVRNRIDDLVLVSTVPRNPADGRATTVVRSLFVDDGTVRMIIKSALRSPSEPSPSQPFSAPVSTSTSPTDNRASLPSPNTNQPPKPPETEDLIIITTCRRSVHEFETLAQCLAIEHPASWLPSLFDFRSPYQLPSRPSRATLNDIQTRLDHFLRIMLTHSTFATHELVWEFVLCPEIDAEMMMTRSRQKAQLRLEKLTEEYEPVVIGAKSGLLGTNAKKQQTGMREKEKQDDGGGDDEEVKEILAFAEHARESLQGVLAATRKTCAKVHGWRLGQENLATALTLSAKAMSSLCTTDPPILPSQHHTALTHYARTMHPPSSDPFVSFEADMQASYSTILAIMSSLARPHALIAQLSTLNRALVKQNGNMTGSMTSKSATKRIISPSSILGSLGGGGGGSRNPTSFLSSLPSQPLSLITSLTPSPSLSIPSSNTNTNKSPISSLLTSPISPSTTQSLPEQISLLGSEIRYTQQTVASELASWHDSHVRMVKVALRHLGRKMVVRERGRLDSLRRGRRMIGSL